MICMGMAEFWRDPCTPSTLRTIPDTHCSLLAVRHTSSNKSLATAFCWLPPPPHSPSSSCVQLDQLLSDKRNEGRWFSGRASSVQISRSTLTSSVCGVLLDDCGSKVGGGCHSKPTSEGSLAFESVLSKEVEFGWKLKLPFTPNKRHSIPSMTDDTGKEVHCI